MIKFELTNGFYIRKFDERNWAIAKMFAYKNIEKEKVRGYYRTLEQSWEACCDIIPLVDNRFNTQTDAVFFILCG